MIPPPSYPAWYADWMEYHLDLFGINDTAASPAFMRWWPAFNAMNVQPLELMSVFLPNGEPDPTQLGASDILQRQGDTPIRISQHYDRLILIIADQRTRKEDLLAIKRTIDADVIGACTDCGDSGYASVPHANDIGTHPDGTKFWKPHRYGEAGNPIYYRFVVVCICPAGRKIKDWQERVEQPKKGKKQPKPAEKKRALLMEDYQMKFFENWRHEVRDVEARMKTLRDVKNQVDSDPEQLIKSLAKGTTLPPKPKTKTKTKPPPKGLTDDKADSRAVQLRGTGLPAVPPTGQPREEGRPEKAIRPANERPAATVKDRGPGPSPAAPNPAANQPAIGGDEEIPF